MALVKLGALERAWSQHLQLKTHRGRPRKFVIHPRKLVKGNPEGRPVSHYVQFWLPAAIRELRQTEPRFFRTSDAIREVMKRLGYEVTQAEVNDFKRVVDREKAKLRQTDQPASDNSMFNVGRGISSLPRTKKVASEETTGELGYSIRRHRGTYGGG